MTSSTKDAARPDREREYDARMQAAARALGALARLVRGRENRAAPGGRPLEVAFAAAGRDGLGGGPTLPAGVWVALRGGDVDAALDMLVAVSSERFVIGEREEIGAGYRLQTVEEVRMLPDLAALRAQLAAMLEIPPDVVAILGEWGSDDPRAVAEIEVLLDSRFGPARRGDAVLERVGQDPAAGVWVPAPVSVLDGAAGSEEARILDRPQLSIGVSELADVLQLSTAQARVLTTLVRHAVLTVVGSAHEL